MNYEDFIKQNGSIRGLYLRRARSELDQALEEGKLYGQVYTGAEDPLALGGTVGFSKEVIAFLTAHYVDLGWSGVSVKVNGPWTVFTLLTPEDDVDLSTDDFHSPILDQTVHRVLSEISQGIQSGQTTVTVRLVRYRKNILGVIHAVREELVGGGYQVSFDVKSKSHATDIDVHVIRVP